MKEMQRERLITAMYSTEADSRLLIKVLKKIIKDNDIDINRYKSIEWILNFLKMDIEQIAYEIDIIEEDKNVWRRV